MSQTEGREGSVLHTPWGDPSSHPLSPAAASATRHARGRQPAPREARARNFSPPTSPLAHSLASLRYLALDPGVAWPLVAVNGQAALVTCLSLPPPVPEREETVPDSLRT